MRKSLMVYAVTSFLIAVSGCGYTTRSLLPPNFKSIYVANFVNMTRIAEEQTDERMYRGYRPGLERDITKAVIDRFLFDGNLKVKNDTSADLVMKGELVDFKKEALRYDANNNVEEYRILLVVNLEIKDVKGDKLAWEEKGFVGETTYRTSGSLAKSEAAAISDAANDLARRIVERTIEAW